MSEKGSFIANQSLFRQKIITKNPPPIIGTIVLAQPLSFRLITMLLASVLVVSVIFLGSVNYSSSISSDGLITQGKGSKSLSFVTFVSPSAALHLSEGLKVKVVIDAFETEGLDRLSGQITSLRTSQATLNSPPGVMVTIQLSENYICLEGRSFELIQGMKGSVILPQENKSVLAWLTPKSLFGSEL